jgi:hypothetical protein
MGRRVQIISLPVLAVALVTVSAGVLVYEFLNDPHAPAAEADRVDQSSSVGKQLDLRNEGAMNREDKVPQDEVDRKTPTVDDAVNDISVVDESETKQWVEEESRREVHRDYALLLDSLDLSSSEVELLLEFLVNEAVANTQTRYSQGKGTGEVDRTKMIAEILGNPNTEQFIERERNLSEYREIQRLQALLESNEVPLSESQLDRLLAILVDTREQFDSKQPPPVEPGTVESLEHTLTELDEYERLVLEKAPSVLTTRQLEYMFQRYQTRSYMRANALELQKQRKFDDPDDEMLPGYPSPRN